MKLTAMTYNIQSGRDLTYDLNIEHAASVVAAVQPDFVVLNEVRSHTSDIGDVNQAWEMGRLTGYYPVFGKSIDILGGEYGNALLTRLPLIESRVVPIPDAADMSDARCESRTVLVSVLDANGLRITVLGSHFGLTNAEKQSAVETVCRLLDEIDTPVVLMGDFNMRPNDEIMKPLFDALNDTARGGETIRTWPSDKKQIKIDYIFVSKDFAVNSIRSLNTQQSDHRPLIARLEIHK